MQTTAPPALDTADHPCLAIEQLMPSGWHEFYGKSEDVLKATDALLLAGWEIDCIKLVRPGAPDRVHVYPRRTPYRVPHISTYAATALDLLRQFTQRAFAREVP